VVVVVEVVVLVGGVGCSRLEVGGAEEVILFQGFVEGFFGGGFVAVEEVEGVGAGA